jgi:DNA-binding transcriptional MerR regulator
MGSMSIGEVARTVGVRPSALRYYESVGLLPSPERTNGRRRYDGEVLREVLVHHLRDPDPLGRVLRGYPALRALASPRPRQAPGGRCAGGTRPRHEGPLGEGAALRMLAPGGLRPGRQRDPRRTHLAGVPEP